MGRAALWFTLASALASSAPARAERRVVTVQAGDVLSTIARRFGVTVSELRVWNALEGDHIRIGQELVIAGEGAVVAHDTTNALEAPDQASAPEAGSAAASEGEALPPSAAGPNASPAASAPAASASPATGSRARRLGAAPVPAPGTDASDRRSARGPTIEVRSGQTLTAIAQQVGVTIPQLVAANPGLDPDRLRAGQTLLLPGSRRSVVHTVARGEVMGRIALRYEVTTRELLRWNPALRSGLRAGQELLIYTEVPVSRSRSIGAAYNGRLEEAERLPLHPAFVIRDRNRAFGTVETVRWILEAFDAVRAAHPQAPRVRVHDISQRRGGRMTHHRSHQSGRDADISYFYHRCGDVCLMRRISPGLLDVERQWTLVEHWLRRGVAEAIFMDYELQAPLYEHARSLGATRQELHRWFQYPRGPSYPLGVVRHFPKHADHLHVRFICPESDPECTGR